MSFTASRTVSSFKISISNDLVAESVEEFFLDLEIPSSAVAAGAVKGSPDNVTVSITDNDSECCVSAPYSSEHNLHIVHLHKCLPKFSGSATLNPLYWSPYQNRTKVWKSSTRIKA